MEYIIHLLILVGIYLILTGALNVTVGLGQLLNLAHVASYAIGAYTTALLATEYGIPAYICFPLSALASAATARPIAEIASRLAADYFAIGTLAFSAVISALLTNWKSLTRGVLGIPGIPRPELAGFTFDENLSFCLLLWTVTVLVLAMVWVLFHSPFGRSLRALAEHPQAAMALGKDVGKIKLNSFVFSAALAGLAGSFFAYYMSYIDPSSFGSTEMVFILACVVVGRPGSFWGGILATIFLVLLPEPLRFVQFSPSIVGPMRQLLFAAVLFGVVYWKRHALFPRERTI